MVVGKFKESKADVTKKISSMGGTVVTKCDKSVAAVISTKGKVLSEGITGVNVMIHVVPQCA